MMQPSKKLVALFNSLKEGRRLLRADLPVYGRPVSSKPKYVWSYDGRFAIYGENVEDLRIIHTYFKDGELCLYQGEWQIPKTTDIVVPPAPQVGF